VIVPAGDATSECIQLPFAAGGANYIGPCGDSTLTFNYLGGNNLDTEGTFQFNLSSPLPSNITITGAGVNLYGTSCGVLEDSASQVGIATITAGNTVTSVASNSVACTAEYARGGFLSVNGNPLSDGGTINIGGVTLTVSINTSCVFLPCLA
jgi:hypothetical protein